MPIIGVIDSQKSGHLTPPMAPAYNSIQTVTVSSNTQYVTFSSIPSTYKHLELRVYARSGRARDINGGLLLSLNGTSTYATYGAYTEAYNGTTPAAFAGAGSNQGSMLQVPGTTANANAYGIGILRFVDYANTNKFKTVLIENGDFTATGGCWTTNTAYWNTTNAVSSITFETTDSGGTTIQAGSVFALYGITG